MIIGIIIGLVFIISIILIIMLKSDNKAKTSVSVKPKVEPITKGRSYPWFYIKECLFYFPITRSSMYESETKQSLVDELIELQKAGDFEKVIEVCDQLIAKDYKFSRAWIDKINAIFNSVLAGKDWNATRSKDILNCCYNYVRTFENNYDKSINAKHSLVPVILKRAQDVIKYNREMASETYSFEIYNLLINLYYLMPFNEILDVVTECIGVGKKLDEINNNQYASDTLKSLESHVEMLKSKHSVALEKEESQELKVTNKSIINDETFSTTWVGFNILFPKNMDRVELMFKFYDQRRQEIDLSGGKNKRMIELFKKNGVEEDYNIVVIGDDRIKHVTVDIYDETKRHLIEGSISDSIGGVEESDVEASTNDVAKKEEVEDRTYGVPKDKNKDGDGAHDITKDKNNVEDDARDISKVEDVEDGALDSTNDDTDDVEAKEESKLEITQYKVYPTFSGIKQIAMSENYCLFLKEDGKVILLGNVDKNFSVKDWDNVEKLYVTPYTAYAIKKDGTISVTGKNVYDSWEYQYVWKDIQKLVPSYNHIVGLKTDGTVVASGDNTHGQCEVTEWTDIVDVSASFHTVGLTKDGNVYAVGSNNFGECDIANWSNIEKIATGPFYTVGLRRNGTVVAAGLNSCGQCNTSDWKDVKEIYARGNVTVGLKYDGTVLVTGRNSYRFEDAKKWNDIVEVKIVNDRIIGVSSEGKINYIGKPYWGRIKEDWNNISSVEANSNCMLGQKHDGTLICNKTLFGVYLPDNYENLEDIKQNVKADKVAVLDKEGKVDVYSINNVDLYKWDVSKFVGIKQISMSETHLTGLKDDGTAVVAGNDVGILYDMCSWRNLVKVETGEKFALGLTIDGRVMATGNNIYGQCDVSDWLDIIDIAVCGSKAVGLKSDGTVVATGFLEYNEEDFLKDAHNIVGIAVNNRQIMLLDSNGNVSLSYNPFGIDNKSVLEWRGISKIVANQDNFIGLKNDKTLITTGIETVENWENISEIKASGEYVIGIMKTKID